MISRVLLTFEKFEFGEWEESFNFFGGRVGFELLVLYISLISASVTNNLTLTGFWGLILGASGLWTHTQLCLGLIHGSRPGSLLSGLLGWYAGVEHW